MIHTQISHYLSYICTANTEISGFDSKILQLNVCESDKLLYFCIPKKGLKTVKNLIDVRNCRDRRPTV